MVFRRSDTARESCQLTVNDPTLLVLAGFQRRLQPQLGEIIAAYLPTLRAAGEIHGELMGGHFSWPMRGAQKNRRVILARVILAACVGYGLSRLGEQLLLRAG